MSNQDVNNLVSDFNSTLLDFSKSLAVVSPNSIIGKNIKDIEKAILYTESKNKFIEIFIEKILIYKEKIDNKDESFFLDKSYNNDLENDASLMSKVFEFKDIWQGLSEQNKNIIFQYMSILCQLSQQYFIFVFDK